MEGVSIGERSGSLGVVPDTSEPVECAPAPGPIQCVYNVTKCDAASDPVNVPEQSINPLTDFGTNDSLLYTAPIWQAARMLSGGGNRGDECPSPSQVNSKRKKRKGKSKEIALADPCRSEGPDQGRPTPRISELSTSELSELLNRLDGPFSGPYGKAYNRRMRVNDKRRKEVNLALADRRRGEGPDQGRTFPGLHKLHLSEIFRNSEQVTEAGPPATAAIPI